MRSRFLILYILILVSSISFAQDSIYARTIIKELTSKKCYGRGYLNNGLDAAAKVITEQLKRFKAQPLFSTGYYQWFDFDVNTFPNNVGVKINGKLLKPGIDYVLNPQSGSIKGKFTLKQVDSVTYKATDSPIPVILSLKRKLMFSVATNSLAGCEVELLNKNQYKDIRTIELNIESKVLTKYINKNICAYIPGKQNNDTCIYITAHYDHLGGLGKKTYFPGANDNASGVSMTLNFVKYFSEHSPKYKTVFVFFAGEEAGLLGSKHFVEKGGIDLKTIKFLINFDLLGTGDDGIMVTNGAVLTREFEMLSKINTEKNYVKELKKRGKAQNSDHYWFTEKGVPAYFIYTLGGIKAYHDVDDIEKTLPLTDYGDVFRLIRDFIHQL